MCMYINVCVYALVMYIILCSSIVEYIIHRYVCLCVYIYNIYTYTNYIYIYMNGPQGREQRRVAVEVDLAVSNIPMYVGTM